MYGLHERAGDLARQQEVGETTTTLEGGLLISLPSLGHRRGREIQPGTQVLGGSQPPSSRSEIHGAARTLPVLVW